MRTVINNKAKSMRRKGALIPVGVRKVVKTEVRNVVGRLPTGQFTKAEPTAFVSIENENGVDAILEGSIAFNGRSTIRSNSSKILRISKKREGQQKKLAHDIAKNQKGSESSGLITDSTLLAMAE